MLGSYQERYNFLLNLKNKEVLSTNYQKEDSGSWGNSLTHIFHINEMKDFQIFFIYSSNRGCYTFIARRSDNGAMTVCLPEEFIEAIPTPELNQAFLYSNESLRFFPELFIYPQI